MSEVSRGGSSGGGGAFAKVVQKTLARTRTKVLQRVGKAEKTTDEVYKDNITAFQRQQAVALRLQKEMKHYLGCVKAMAAAAKGLYAVLKETYEEDWYDAHSFNSSLSSLELMQTNYEAELAERVFADLNEYVEQFPIYKEKMNKRNRKRLDYDNSKHAYETLHAAKKPDHTKISRAHESLLDTKGLFEEINNELHDKLPKFYDYRVSDQLIDLLQTVAKSHAEEMERLSSLSQTKKSSIVQDGAGEGLDLSSLSQDVQSPHKPNGHGVEVQARTPRSSHQQKVTHSDEPETQLSRAPPPARPATTPLSPASTDGNPFVISDDDESEHTSNSQPLDNSTLASTDSPGNPFEDEPDADETDSEPTTPKESSETVAVIEEPTVSVHRSTVTPTSDSKASTSRSSSVSTVLYQVMATHPYIAEDEDELAFDAGEIVNVVPFDGADEQDDGWLMGINVNTLAKGVFPANFTQKIESKT